MKRTGKRLTTLFVIGLAGAATVLGVILGTGHIRPYAQTQRYSVENVQRAQLNLHSAQVTAVPAAADYRVEIYVNAWLPNPIDFDQIAAIEVADGTLTVTETPFPAEFLGVFPQPYEMNITLYLSAAACEQIEEART